MAPRSPELFPYMFWAQSEAWASAYSLAASGMPAPDPALLGLSGPPERVLVGMGASGVMHLLAMRFFPGSHVVTDVPSYEPFRTLAAFYGSSHALVRRRFEEGFALGPEAVEEALAAHGGRPAHVFVATPHNPTGRVSTSAELQFLADRAGHAGGILIANEVYMEFAPAAERVHAFALAPNAISIGSLTKAYGLGALRIGWAVLGAGLVDERVPLLDHSYLVSVDPPTPSLRAAHRALHRLEALLQPARQLEARCRPRLARWLEDCEHVEGVLGPYGLTAFPRVHGVDDTRDLARHLARTVQVDVVPGEFFGAPGHLRVGYAAPEETLRVALERLSEGIASYRRGSPAP